MNIRVQPKPEIKIQAADKGIVSRKEYFVRKNFEEINQYFFPAHLIRNWRPKAELLYPPVPDETTVQYEVDFNRDVQNCFVEDYAEEVFLRTPPPCFVVIGKCGTKVSKLSEDIAKEYGSVLIQVDDVVSQVIKTESETAKILHRILRLGVSLTLNFVLALLSYVAHTPEARHRGYVLCGLPSIPHLYDLSVEQQFNYLFTWDNKPTVFINVLFEDEDLVNERTNRRCEISKVGEETCILVHPKYNEISEEDEEEEEEDELLPIKENTSGYERDIDISPSRSWAQLPRDEESQVWSELELFDLKIKPIIELIISRVDPQYLITVDSRVDNEFEVVQTRLSLLRLWKSPIASPFIPLKEVNVVQDEDYEETETELTKEEEIVEESEEDAEIRRVAEEPPETAFLILFSKKTISPRFRWELSHYNFICPVSLRAGQVIRGNSEFAVLFLKYIYFLRDRESMIKFLQNPRPYVLPIRPKPPCRFIILGYPLTGKTTLAKSLAAEFSIPVIDVNTILKNDLERKKDIYQEFCRQKAESREITRLTAQAWKDWRLEEERRIHLIEEWISYVQTLLEQRIKQFYAVDDPDNASYKETQVQSYSPEGSIQMGAEGSEGSKWSTREKSDGGNLDEGGDRPLEVRGVSVSRPSGQQQTDGNTLDNNSTPSSKIIQALKHDDFDFNENGLEVEANLFFTSLWNTFSSEDQRRFSFLNPPNKYGEEEGEGGSISGEAEESINVNWCSLLPPQSLSSLLMKKRPLTLRQKRKSFQIFLEAASKAYWAPSVLKNEFVKWRLPCFMDIPLCELFLDNPILLFRYVPEWLKERPLIPNPVDPKHPSVIEAGRQAYLRASVVTVQQNTEEKGILLLDAIEKAEREGMRVTGEVISPGGWVVDNMVLDQDVWTMMAKRNVFADHFYILVDSEPEFSRIISTWCEMHCLDSPPRSDSDDSRKGIMAESEVEINSLSDGSGGMENSRASYQATTVETDNVSREIDLISLLTESYEILEQGSHQLDEIFDHVINFKKGTRIYIPPFSVDLFCHNLLQNTVEVWCDLIEESQMEDVSGSTHNVFSSRQAPITTDDIPIGVDLELFTNQILSLFERKFVKPQKSHVEKAESIKSAIPFFIYLLTLPNKLKKIKEWLNNLNWGVTINEIDIVGKSPDAIFQEIKKELYAPFLKKPRELESFEAEELREIFEREDAAKNKNPDDDIEGEDLKEPEEEKEDVRIYGEAGPLCVVNLERGILLLGKTDICLRYYGKLYFFYDEAAKQKFIEDPEKYAPYYSPIRCLPPLRIFVVGPVGSGKSSMALPLSNQCGLKYEDYTEFVNRKLLPHNCPYPEKLMGLIDQKLLLSDDHSKEAKIAVEQFLSAPFSKRHFWLDNPFYVGAGDDQKRMFDDFIQMNHPPPLNLPELTYKCIESASEENLESEPEKLENSAEVFISMRDIEKAVPDYFKNSADLPEYCLKKTLNLLWNREPHASRGFLIEGFPLKYSDVKNIIENNWIPDLVIELMLSEDDVVDNNIDYLMELWDTKLKHEIIEEKLLEEAVSAIYRNRFLAEKNRLVTEKRSSSKAHRKNTGTVENPIKEATKEISMADILFKPRKASSSAYSISDSESKIQVEVEEILKKDFPKLVFNPNFETFEAGKARIINNLQTTYRNDSVEIEKIKTALKEIGVPWMEMNGLLDKKKNYTDAMLRLDELRRRVGCKGEFAFSTSTETAEKLLQQGYYFLSKFGRWCPVQVYRMKNSIHMYRPLSKRARIIPVVYRNYIYFVGGVNEKKTFIDDPLKYTFNEPHHPNIPLRVAVIGPPKSGKTSLCRRLGLMFDLKVVTMGTALRFVLEKIPESSLAKCINNYLRRGCFLPLSLKVEALVVCLNDPVCVTQGFIFDGIPFDAALAQSLSEEGKLPFVIISLVAEPDFGKTNREELDLKEFRLEYKNRVNLDTKYTEWDETYKRFFQWNQDTYNNIYEVNAKSNLVDIFYQAYDIIRKSFFAILYYVEYCVSERALPLQYLCVGQHEYELRKSSFHNNCPVCWSESNKLNSSTDPPPRSGLVQYLNHFYWICPDHKEKFLKSPKKYLRSQEFPKDLPKVLNRAMFETASPQLKIHGNGRCPVTRIDFPESLDWEGSWNFAVFYRDEVYLCKNQKMLGRFLAQPWKYCDADTEFEVNRITKSDAVEQLGPPIVTSLPPIGFLEQTVANLIHESLQLLGTIRPVYPDLNPGCTGCIFVALFLKVHNKKNKRPHLEKEYLDLMMKQCSAFRFNVGAFRKELEAANSLEAEPIESHDSDSTETEVHGDEPGGKLSHGPSEYEMVSIDSCWLDLESQADKKMWSARIVKPNYHVMNFTLDNELLEIPDVPKVCVVLKLQLDNLRPSPLPPVVNCLTFLYSCKPGIQIPEKFNYNSLYQPLVTSSSPYYSAAPMYNPEKEFALELYKSDKLPFPSEPNLWKRKRALSESTLEEVKFKKVQNPKPDLQYMIERFIPRFYLFDTVVPTKLPPVPKAVEMEPIFYNPHRDYTYTMLLSHFFHSSHVLRCYEWDECKQRLEYSNRMDRNLGLTNVQVEFFNAPQKSESVETRASIRSYQDHFDMANVFFVREEEKETEDSEVEVHSRKSSVINFVQGIILEKLHGVFAQLSTSELSYYSYEILQVPSEVEAPGKPSVVLQEVFPFPPLIWDIISRPYYAYQSIRPIFEVIHLDNIAHERHVSLLDGIKEPNESFRFVRYPSWVQGDNNSEMKVPPILKRRDTDPARSPVKVFLMYDFFNLDWTSFLAYPFLWASRQNTVDNFNELISHESQDGSQRHLNSDFLI